MRQASITFDDETLGEWGFAPFHDAEVLDVEVLSCEGARGVARIHVEDKPDEQRLDESDTIEWWEQVSNERSEYIYLVEGDTSDTLDMMDADTVPRTEHVTIHEQGFTLEYAGPQEQISEMMARFEANGINVTLEKLQSYHVKDSLLDTLTDRQQEVLEVAFGLGYYDVPRRATTTKIATDLGLDDSTVSEHLQRAERNLLTAVLGRAP